jgi:hypothetical protein
MAAKKPAKKEARKKRAPRAKKVATKRHESRSPDVHSIEGDRVAGTEYVVDAPADMTTCPHERGRRTNGGALAGMAQRNEADSNGADPGAVVPSISDMISASVGTPESGPTTLDDFAVRIEGLDGGESGGAAQAPALVLGEPAKRGRGRPRKDGTSPQPGTAPKTTRKAELAAELERVTAELEAERARNDGEKIAELSKLVTMAATMGFGAAAAQRGPHWALKPSEAQAIGETGAVVLAPYADKAQKHMPWLMFATVLGNALWQRFEIDGQMVAQLNRPTIVQP